MTNSVVDSPPQVPAAGAWGSLFTVQQPAKSRHVSVVPPSAAKKKPAYGVKRSLDMCTEALGCETGGIDTAADDADEGAARKRRAYDEAEEMKVEPMARKVRELPPPLTTLAAGTSRMRMVHVRRNGRLEMYAVRVAGIEAERSGGRLLLRCLPRDGCNVAMCSSQQEPQEAEEDVIEEVEQQEIRVEDNDVAKYMRLGRCVKLESAATAARCGTKWEPEQAAAFLVAITLLEFV